MSQTKVRSALVKVDQIKVPFDSEDSDLVRLKRCSRAIQGYTDQLPSRERVRYRVYLRSVDRKRAVYDVMYDKESKRG